MFTIKENFETYFSTRKYNKYTKSCISILMLNCLVKRHLSVERLLGKKTLKNISQCFTSYNIDGV